MKTNTLYKAIFAFIILIILSAGFVSSLYFVSQKTEIVKELSIKNSQIKDFEFGANLKEQMNLLSTQEAKIKNTFISASELLGFIKTLEQLALESNLKITIDKVEEGEKELVSDGIFVHSTVFNLQVAGSYEDIISFIKLLSQSDKKLTFDKISMYQSESEETVTHTARMTLTGLILSYE